LSLELTTVVFYLVGFPVLIRLTVFAADFYWSFFAELYGWCCLLVRLTRQCFNR
jgi:hypothetical protein